MPPAQRSRPGRRLLIGALSLALAAACGPRVAPVPLEGDDGLSAPPPLASAPAAAPPATATLTEEDLPEIAAPDPTTTAPADPAADPAAGPAPAPGELAVAAPSPLASIGPGTPANVAAATRLADAARAQLAAGDEATALEQLERAIAIDPNNAYAYFFLAELHFHTHSYDQAVAFADRAAALGAATSPEWTSRAWCLQGNAFEAAGRFADARQAYLRAVRVAPNNLAALVGLTRIGGGTTP